MAAALETISGRNDRSVIMDKEKKKQINEAIAIIRDFCIEHKFCSDCPFGTYVGDGYYCDFPYNWEKIE